MDDSLIQDIAKSLEALDQTLDPDDFKSEISYILSKLEDLDNNISEFQYSYSDLEDRLAELEEIEDQCESLDYDNEELRECLKYNHRQIERDVLNLEAALLHFKSFRYSSCLHFANWTIIKQSIFNITYNTLNEYL